MGLLFILVSAIYPKHLLATQNKIAHYSVISSFVLYIIYFPLHLRYCRTLPLPPSIESHLRDPSPHSANNGNTYAGSGAVYAPEDGVGSEETPLLRNGNGRGNGTGYGVDGGKGDGERKRVKLEWTGEWRLAVILAVVVTIHL